MVVGSGSFALGESGDGEVGAGLEEYGLRVSLGESLHGMVEEDWLVHMSGDRCPVHRVAVDVVGFFRANFHRDDWLVKGKALAHPTQVID